MLRVHPELTSTYHKYTYSPEGDLVDSPSSTRYRLVADDIAYKDRPEHTTSQKQINFQEQSEVLCIPHADIWS